VINVDHQLRQVKRNHTDLNAVLDRLWRGKIPPLSLAERLSRVDLANLQGITREWLKGSEKLQEDIEELIYRDHLQGVQCSRFHVSEILTGNEHTAATAAACSFELLCQATDPPYPPLLAVQVDVTGEGRIWVDHNPPSGSIHAYGRRETDRGPEVVGLREIKRADDIVHYSQKSPRA